MNDEPEINGLPATLSYWEKPAGFYGTWIWSSETQSWEQDDVIYYESMNILDFPASIALTELEFGSDYVAVYDGLDGIAENLGSATKFAEIKGIQNLTVNHHSRTNWVEEHSFYLT